MAKLKGKVRRVGRRIKARVKAAKPSLAIIAGLGIPPAQVVTGASNQYGVKNSIFSSGISDKWGELKNRFMITYLGDYQRPTIATAVQSTAVKAGVLGFVVHWLANISGANRYLARMKAPVRI